MGHSRNLQKFLNSIIQNILNRFKELEKPLNKFITEHLEPLKIIKNVPENTEIYWKIWEGIL